jgi:ubiquinone/menaquinone biosynthesis C-methylase UbiE
VNTELELPDPALQKALDIEYHRVAAAEYDESVTRHFHFYHRYWLNGWAKELLAERPGAAVLDIGTGSGVVACTLASFGCQVRGIDHSIDMLARAKARAHRMNLDSKVVLEVGDAEHLRFPDQSFDAVAIQGVLHHLSDVMPALRQAIRVLKPGGRIFISEPCLETTWIGRAAHKLLHPFAIIRDRIRGAAELPSVSAHEKPLLGEELIRAVQSLGITTDHEYMIRLGAVRFIPEWMKIWVILLLSFPTRRSHGDLIFLTGRRTSIVNQLPPDASRVPDAAVTSQAAGLQPVS